MSDTATIFYSADPDAERLSATSVTEAVIDYFDQHGDPISRDELIEVTSYRPMELPPRERLAEWLIDEIRERLDDQYADPDDSASAMCDSDVLAPALALADAIRKHYIVWACEPVETSTVKVADHVPSHWIGDTDA